MPGRLDNSTIDHVSDDIEPSPDIDELVESHQRLVMHLAWSIKRRLSIRAEIADLAGYGQLGLIEAASRFHPSRKVAFATFAHYRIRGAIFDGLGKMTWLPPAARVRLAAEEALDDVAQSIQDDESRTSQELEQRFESSIRSLGAVYAISHLDATQGSAEPAAAENPSLAAERQELMDRVRACIAKLEDKEALVIQWHYFEGMSLTECATRLQCGKPWVTRLHQRALRKLWNDLSAAE